MMDETVARLPNPCSLSVCTLYADYQRLGAGVGKLVGGAKVPADGSTPPVAAHSVPRVKTSRKPG
jgi:hypothetical protein